MATTDSEIVELIIDAKNLTSDELNKAAADVTGLGAAARKAEADLEKLKIKKSTIASYDEVGSSVKELRQELSNAEVSYENLDKATKKNKDSTDEQRAAVKLSKKELKDLQATLRDQEREYNSLSKAVKSYGVTVKNTKDKQNELNAEIDAASAKVKSQTAKYREQGQALKGKVAAEKDSIKVTKEAAIAAEKLAKEQAKAAAEAKKLAAAESKLAKEAKRVEDALVKYELSLEKLNSEKKAGSKTSAQYIRGEARLRKELKLSEAQVRSSRQAIQADIAQKTKATKNTDILTSATRRLAQVYTVLIAAQKAAQAVGAGVKEYGALEAAITKVEKTTGLAREQVVALTDEFKELSEDVTPNATNELARFAQVAGQLGVKSTADILSLVSAADALERSTNLAGDEATELLARILTMTGEGIPSIHNLSSSVVALGNNFAVSEKDIVHMTKEIISGTREIGLGSAAAAAFGTTLKELGQPAERSRTAIQRLGGAIKRASIEGGDDLERLTQITGLTADEIEKNLGDRPEQVLVSFLKGLNNVDKAGGQVSTVLKRMGIDGTEATGVLSVLAGGTERLEKALKLSNGEFINANAHMKEAAKSYSDQEAALGRLSNKFTNLTAKIGEAFSDETDLAIRSMGDAIDDTKDDVVGLIQFVPELVEGIVELAQSVENFADLFGQDEGIGAIEGVLNTIKLSFNGITLLLNTMVLSTKEAVLHISSVFNYLNKFDGYDISDDFITNLEKSISHNKDLINQDLIDIENANKRLAGESSKSFEGLISITGKYGQAVATLSQDQQTAIKAIIDSNKYVKEEENLYRELTAAIVRANREVEIEAALKKRSQGAATDKLATDELAIQSAADQAAAQEKVNISLQDYQQKVKDVAQVTSDFEESRKQGIITDETATSVIDALTNSLNKYNVVSSEGDALNNLRVNSTKEYLAALDILDAKRKEGLITEGQYIIAQEDLNKGFADTKAAIDNAIAASGSLSLSQATLNDKIVRTEATIRGLNTELKKGNNVTNEAIQLTAKLIKEEAKLKDLKAEQQRNQELESATYFQLLELQRQYTAELESINAKFKSGALTKAEYAEQTRNVSTALNELNAILGDNSKELEKNTVSTKKNVVAKTEQVQASKQATSFLSLELQVAGLLGKEYDQTGKTIGELTKRYDELVGSINHNRTVTGGWFENLAKVSNEVFRQEKAVVSETIALREWVTQIESGSLSMEELGKRAAFADQYFTSLSDNQMKPLRDAISKAQSEFAELSATIDGTISDVQDRLDAALGNASAITKRQFERELAEMQALIDQANEYGNTALVRQLQAALADLKKAQKLEFKSEYGDKTQAPSAPAGQQQSSAAPQSSGAPQDTAVLQLQVGDQKFPTQVSKDILSQLMIEITKQKGLGN